MTVGVLERGERLRGSPLGCTRVLAAVPGRALSLGITAIGGPDHHSAEQRATWREHVRAAAEELGARLATIPEAA